MEILEKVRSAEKMTSEVDKMATQYERIFPSVARFVRNMGGSFEDARDIFHDALLIYFENAARGGNTIASTAAYVTGISKHLWARKYHRDMRKISWDDTEKHISIAEDYFPTVNDKKLLRLLNLTGKRCMELLRAFYCRRFPAEKIAAGLGYSNDHSASVQKYKCLEKVRNVVKKKSLAYDDFTE